MAKRRRVGSQPYNDGIYKSKQQYRDTRFRERHRQSGIRATCQWFVASNYDADLGDFRTQAILTNGGHRFTFRVPVCFESLIKVSLIGIISAAAASAGRDIDFDSDYATVGEAYNTHSETDHASTYDLSGQGNKLYAFDVTALFPDMRKNDYCGIYVKHNAIGGQIDYLGVRLDYYEHRQIPV